MSCLPTREAWFRLENGFLVLGLLSRGTAARAMFQFSHQCKTQQSAAILPTFLFLFKVGMNDNLSSVFRVMLNLQSLSFRQEP